MSECKTKRIVYFERPGVHNTSKLVNAVKRRVKEGDIKYLVVASVTGQTAVRVAEQLNDLGVSIVDRSIDRFLEWASIFLEATKICEEKFCVRQGSSNERG